MTSSASQRVVLLCNSVALGFGLYLLTTPARAHASDPDIPHLQVDAERGSIKEEIELGAAYFVGRGVPQDEKRAAYWYEKAANAGDPGAQKQIGYFYEMGIGVTRDPARAVRWYERAVAGGLISAKVNLGVAYLLGEGARKDTEMAEQLFRQAFARGDGRAACFLGEMYFRGLGVQRDEAAGERWYEAGAKLHDPRAQFLLANLLWQRQSNASDLKRAAKLMRESAAGGLVAAKHQLAILLVKNPELAASPQEVPTLLKEAAEAGEWRSSMALGLLSRNGMGVPVDSEAAYYHYRVAVLQGGDEARRVVAHDLDVISARLGPEQAAAIDSEAETFVANHHLALQFVNKDGARLKEYPTYALVNPDHGAHAERSIPTQPSDYLNSPPGGKLSTFGRLSTH